MVDVRELGRDLHGLTEQAFLLVFGKLLLINNKRLILGINVAVLVFLTVRLVGQHILWLPLVRVLIIFETLSQMLIVVLSCHRAIPDLQSLSIKIIVIGSYLPLYVFQKLFIFFETITLMVSTGKLLELGTKKLILLIHLL